MDDPYLLHHLFAQLRLQQTQAERRKGIRRFCLAVSIAIISIGVVFSLECHTHTMNAYFGPFHVDVNEFVELAQAFNQSRTRFLFTSWNEFRYLVYHKIYLQVELGQENIERKPGFPPRVYQDPDTRTGHIATFHHVLHFNVVTLFYPNRVFIKMPAYPIKLPFRFSAFSIKTLRCIVRELGIAPATYMLWPDKQDYLSLIEKRYAQDFAHFNEAILVRCGLFVGFFMRPKTHIEKAYRSLLSSASWFDFDPYDVALDVTRLYRPYSIFTAGFIACIVTFIALLVCTRTLIMHRSNV